MIGGTGGPHPLLQRAPPQRGGVGKGCANMAVSIIIPVHNAQAFLLETLVSVNSALRSDDEMVIVFDNCSDMSLEIFLEWDRRLQSSPQRADYCLRRYKTGLFGGVANARNSGLEIAEKEWIGFADHDDFVAPTAYRDLIFSAESCEADVVRSGFCKAWPDGKTEVVFPNFVPEFYAFFGIFVWNSLFKAELITQNRIRFTPGYGEDYEFNLWISRFCKKQAFLDDVTYTWIQGGNNLHKKRKPIDFLKRVTSILENHIRYLTTAPNARYSFIKWVVEYSEYLISIFSAEEMGQAFVKARFKDSLDSLRYLSSLGNSDAFSARLDAVYQSFSNLEVVAFAFEMDAIVKGDQEEEKESKRLSSARAITPLTLLRLLQIKMFQKGRSAEFRILFDEEFYTARYPESISPFWSPFEHFLLYGKELQLDPNEMFSTKWYLKRYHDVRESTMNPLEHYFKYGAKEMRNPHPCFSAIWYLESHPDLQRTGENPLLHYLRNREGVS